MEQHTSANSRRAISTNDRKPTSTTRGEHTSGNDGKHTTAKDAKQLLSSIQSNIRRYKVRKEAIRASKEEIDLIAATEQKTQDVFKKKFATVTKQIHAYRNLLNSILIQVNIDVRVESQKERSLICKLPCEYEYCVLFAIANKIDPLSDRFVGCNFLAVCGNAESNHINVYEYTEEPGNQIGTARHFRRRIFKGYSQHLADDHIDKFNIEDMTYYIERYIDKELKCIIASS